MKPYLLVINAGSSSIKFALYQTQGNSQLAEDCRGRVEGIGNTPSFKVMRSTGEVLADNILANDNGLDHKASLGIIIAWLMDYLGDGKLLAAGHRVVHGGVSYAAPVMVNGEVLADLAALIPLAPLHQPHNLAAIRALQEILPDLPQVACFDTAFHQTQPEIAQYTSLPKRYFQRGIRRYGFHGLSYEHIVSILPTLDTKLINARIIAAHLGNGASLCAIHQGRSIATTMGFSTLDGLMMGTRCGNLDPGVLLYLMEHDEMDAKALAHLLYFESGLLGVSGISSDLRTLLASRELAAKEAVDLFVYRINREIGSLIAAMEGIDALVFTGGIGENAIQIRESVCNNLDWLGMKLDQAANSANKTKISTPDSTIAAWVVKADENHVIAQHVQRLCV